MAGDLDRYPRDRYGYLLDRAAWTPELAVALAGEEGILLSDAHWSVIRLLRAFYQRHAMLPNNRVLVRLVRDELGAEQGNSAWLMGLFPGGALKQASKLAGLPRPEQCF